MENQEGEREIVASLGSLQERRERERIVIGVAWGGREGEIFYII